MSTGHTSSSFAANSASPAIRSSTSTAMNSAVAHTAAPIRSLTIRGISEISSATTIPASARRAIFSDAVSSLPSTIVPGVAEAHARHLVHEPPGHEGHDRQARVVLGHPTSQLGLHPAARLGVDDDRLGLGVGLEQRHELGVRRADDRVASDRNRGRLAEPGRGQGGGHLGGHAAACARSRRPDRACRTWPRPCAGPPMPPILITSGTMIPRQLGPMMRAPCSAASSTI